ncbi:FAS1 domain-containing protein [Endogone sp. FLAS-F59071]|nr:FAS1 domain-containing protein [Endogone sp. FLAS-F59071]|eukprot:RUS13332.1 FAS1 domain-containing protein [Endogone sp. FLAS-F59071]
MNIVGRLVLLFLVFATTVLAQDYTIKELLSHNSDTQILSKLLEKSEYSELATLLNDRIHGYTLFAPSDTALRSILENDNHASNASLILNTLYYHIIHGPVRSEYLLPVQFPETLLTNPGFVNLPGNNSGQVVAVVKDQNEVTLYDGAATLNELVRVIQADLNANNGIVHIIDHVLIPPTSVTSTVRAANLTMFYTAINATNITNGVDTAKGITIFAPSNEALLSALKEGQDLNSSIKTIKNILEYHILNEGTCN